MLSKMVLDKSFSWNCDPQS